MHDNQNVAGLVASLGARFAAQFLDTLIAFVPLLVFTIAARLLDLGDGYTASIAILGVLFVLFYVLFADGMSGGQSWGKRLLAIAVVDQRSGEPCTYAQSFVRNLSLSLLSIVDWIFIFGAKRQRLGDMIAGTFVVYVPRS